MLRRAPRPSARSASPRWFVAAHPAFVALLSAAGLFGAAAAAAEPSVTGTAPSGTASSGAAPSRTAPRSTTPTSNPVAPAPAAVAAATKETAAPQKAPAPVLPVEQYVLPNGLTVLLHEAHEQPVVAVEVVYLVGSGHEPKGRTGFAHLFEHLMFQGSKNYDQEYFTPFEPIGADVNGTTNYDRTNYYEELPSNYLELPLWLESDRMRSLDEALTQDKLDNQRDVVKNERRQRYEIAPYGMDFWYLGEALFPAGHPYHHTPIGSHEDLSAASLDDVRSFFERYYVPRNAALVIAGDFDRARVKSLVQKYFGDIAGGERAARPKAEPVTLPGPVHWVAEDDIELPRVYLAWHSPALFEAGDAELDLLSSVLTTGKTSRLGKSLIYEKRLAKEIAAYQVSQRLSGIYVIEATAAPGVSVDQLAAELDAELTKALATPPSADELERAKNGYKKDFYLRLETYQSRASLIGGYFLFTGNGDYIGADFGRYEDASSDGIFNAAKAALDPTRRVRLDFVRGQKGKLEKRSAAGATVAAPATAAAPAAPAKTAPATAAPAAPAKAPPATAAPAATKAAPDAAKPAKSGGAK